MGTEESYTRAEHSICGFSSGSNELLNSDGFHRAAKVCHHLLQCFSLEELLSLGIMQDYA